MKNVYEKLLKIKKPVLIGVCYSDNTNILHRYRILYPNGNCEYSSTLGFYKSCFKENTLENTIIAMKRYDADWNLRITKFEEI